MSGAVDSSAIFLDAFRQGLRDNGLIEKQDYVIDVRYADSDYARFPAFAAELVHGRSVVIVVTTISAARAAQRATSTIPIIMTSLIHPVGQGLIASLSRPGGNTTGLANLADDVMPKLVEMLRALLPDAKIIAILFNPANSANRKVVDSTTLQSVSIGVTLSPIEFKGKSHLTRPFLISCGNLPMLLWSCQTPRFTICAPTFRTCCFSIGCRRSPMFRSSPRPVRS